MDNQTEIRPFITTDGLRLNYQYWIAKRPKALIIYVHDLSDHIERHHYFVNFFVKSNYAVALYDQRGHGRSEKNKADDRLGDYVNDLANFIYFTKQSISTDVPIFVVGQGVGSLILINLLSPSLDILEQGFELSLGRIDGFACISPFIQPYIEKENKRKKLIKNLKKIFNRSKVSFYENTNLIADDPVVNKKFKEDPLVRKFFAKFFYKQIIENTHLIMAAASRIRIPGFLAHSQNNKFALTSGTKSFFHGLTTYPKRLCIYEDGKHDLINDFEKERTLTDLDNWICDVCNVHSSNKLKSFSKETIC